MRLFKIVVTVMVVLILGVLFGTNVGRRAIFGPLARPLTDRTFQRTPERLARGKYLAESVSGCMYCHSPHDWTKHDAPITPGMLGAGELIPLADLPGRVFAPNLTPEPDTGAGNWTDDQLARAIREGVGHDGHTLFPLMPYPHFRQMSDEDLASVIVYLRSLAPVRNPLPATEIIFPVKYFIRAVPQPLTQPVPEPDLSTPVKRGEHLVDQAGCSDCHTPMAKGEPMPGLDFAGGQIFEGPWGRVASANITPDASGVSYYDEALFVNVIRTGYVKARKLAQIMPWTVYRGMTDDDLKATFAYLRTLKPLKHRVDNTEPATPCRLCRTSHGAGNAN